MHDTVRGTVPVIPVCSLIMLLHLLSSAKRNMKGPQMLYQARSKETDLVSNCMVFIHFLKMGNGVAKSSIVGVSGVQKCPLKAGDASHICTRRCREKVCFLLLFICTMGSYASLSVCLFISL